MIVLDRKDKSQLVDHIVDVLTTTPPADCIDGFKPDDKWFYINDRGNVGLNLRNIGYSLSKVITKFVEECNPSWGNNWSIASATHQQQLAYRCYESAMSRAGVKEYKKYLKRENAGQLLEKHKKELIRIDMDISNMRERRAYLQEQIELLDV